MDLFINTSLNHTSIRSHLISQPNNKPNSNSEQLFNATNLSPVIFCAILPPKLRRKISINTQINAVTSNEKKIPKYLLSKYYKIAVLVHQLYVKIKLLKIKRKKGQLLQGLLILPLYQKEYIKTPGNTPFRGNLREMPLDGESIKLRFDPR